MAEKVLVTGGSGFLGINLIRFLRGKGSGSLIPAELKPMTVTRRPKFCDEGRYELFFTVYRRYRAAPADL